MDNKGPLAGSHRGRSAQMDAGEFLQLLLCEGLAVVHKELLAVGGVGLGASGQNSQLLGRA